MDCIAFFSLGKNITEKKSHKRDAIKMRRKHFRRNEPIKFMAKPCNSDSSGLQKAGEKDSHLLLYRHEKQQQQQPNETETK